MPLSIKTKMTIAMRNFPFWIAFFIDLNVQPRIQILNEVQYVKAVKRNERGDDLKCHQNTLNSKNYKSLKRMGQSIIQIKTIQSIHPSNNEGKFLHCN